MVNQQMKLNKDCVKDVLNYIIKNAIVEFTESNVGYKGLSLLSVLDGVSNENNYDKEVVLHSVIFANKHNLIDTNRQMGDGSKIIATLNFTQTERVVDWLLFTTQHFLYFIKTQSFFRNNLVQLRKSCLFNLFF